MGSGDWFKSMISSRKSKEGRSKKVKTKIYKGKKSNGLANGIKSEILESAGVSIETIAATRIQTAFRAYKARKYLRRLRGFTKLKTLTQGCSVQKQASTTVTHLHSWSKIQAEIRARRICMVTEDRLKRQKLRSQLKLEAKIHDLEVEWCGGSETMEETIARLHLREEAAVKRERTMAYAFSHQWRANCSQGLGNYELGKASWSWSWKDRWIAVRPWESRVPSATISPRKDQNKRSSKVKKDKKSSTTSKQPVSVKTPSASAKGTKPLGMGGSQRLLTLAQHLRQYKAPSFPEDIMEKRIEESGGKVVSQVGFPEAATPVGQNPEKFRPKKAAVLICLFEGDDGDLRVILTKRSSQLSTHSGEVALPGGKAEEGDKDDGDTAKREAKEEIGLDPELVNVVTVLQPFLSKHLLRVVPVIAILNDKKSFKPVLNPAEVEAVFDAPLEMFLKDENRKQEEREWMGEKFLLHFFDYGIGHKKYLIWGLTAGILIRAASVVYQRPPAFVEQNPKFKVPQNVSNDTTMP